MAPLVLKQLTILLWKSWIMRKRHWISAIFEILFPLLMIIIMAYVKYNGSKGMNIPEQSQEEGWIPATYFGNVTRTYSIKELFARRNSYNKNDPRILYAPQNTFTIALMDRFTKICGENATITGVGHEDEIFANLTTTNYDNTFGIIFLNDEKDENHLNVKIRIKDMYISRVASMVFPAKTRPGPAHIYDGSSESYEASDWDINQAFIRIQIALNEAYLNYLSKNDRKETVVADVTTHQMAYPKYLKTSSDAGYINLISFVGVMVVVGYIVMAPLIVKRITDEKVAKAKEMLRMMGLSDWVFWGSHFINFFSVMVVQSAIITILLFVGFGGLPFFLWSSGFIFFISMILYNISTILSCMLVTTVFNRPVIAVVVSVILFEVSHDVPWALLDTTFKTPGSKMPSTAVYALTCFLPNMGIQWVITLMGNVEMYGHGLTWSNMWEKSQLYGDFTVGYALLMQFLSIFFYGFLIWYVDNIWPFQYGIPKPFYYPFLPSYWFPNKDKSDAIESKESMGSPEYFEKEPNFGSVGIKCQNLQKVFNKKMAVNDVSLNIYSGQITVLLGHNGAGKTTTMNMITGIFPPTNGTAFIDGYDVRQQTKKARRSMALCPQENILYNELSVYEHLKLYAVLKDHPWHDLDQEIMKTLQMVGLGDKQMALSTELSGGMKRKLCLGIAMIANSSILVLDEPTSGMDPEARRHMWDVLQNIRSQRTILLTTHYMEEADALGDRIAIMSEGMVKCCGTPMFLKKTFGAGYHLRIAKNANFNKDRVLTIVRNYMPKADIKSEIQSEIIYSLESEDQHQIQNQEQTKSTSSVLAQLFSDLESRKVELSINSCGLTVTTMEDVFLRVGNEFTDSEMTTKSSRNGSGATDEDRLFKTIPKNYGWPLRLQQFKALFLKRFHYAKRYWPMLIMQIVLPAILFMCVLLIDNSMKKGFLASIVDRNLDLQALYGNTEGFVKFGPNGEQFKDSYTKAASSAGVHVSVIDKNPDNWTIDGKKDTDMSSYIKTYLVGAEINSTDTGVHLTPWYNKEASHTLPPSINILYQALLNHLLPDKGASISLHNHPIPEDWSMNAIMIVSITCVVSCLLLIPLTVPFLGASYVLFPIHERVSNSKLLQLMNGLSSFNFWSASYLFDILTHLLATILLFVVFLIFDFNKVFSGSDSSRTALFFMFFLFGFASIPLAYLTSLRLKKPSSGYALLVIIYLVTGLVLVLGLGFLDLMITNQGDSIMSRSSFETILFFARLLPVFSMSFGIQKIYKVGSYQSACDNTLPVYLEKQCNREGMSRSNEMWGCCPNKCEANHECYKDYNPLDFGAHGVGIEFTYLVCTGFLYLLVLWIIENFDLIVLYVNQNILKRNSTGIHTTFPPNNGLVLNMTSGQFDRPLEDSDVLTEKLRVSGLVDNNEVKNEAIVVKDLTKTFGKLIPIQAVNHLSFAVHKEECFGLLGVNGAGKTTTFRMLTGDESVAEGNAWIQSYSLRQELRDFQKQIGYCPQFDALLDKMTGSETLFMFCRLRGMPEEMISGYVNDLVDMVDLGKHVNKCTETYSGGNRRKLSLAIALCAAPPVIFLDEPTSGVDPSARRKIWSTLAYLQERYGSAFILTSHSMEECEALCSRLAIMVNGQFQCFGSVQHLRSKFGQGFTIMAKLRLEQTAYMADIQTYFKQQFPSAVLKDVHQCLLHYHIADTSMLWSKMFAVMEEIKLKFLLEDYVISDTTLEQIFLAFARRQR